MISTKEPRNPITTITKSNELNQYRFEKYHFGVMAYIRRATSSTKNMEMQRSMILMMWYTGCWMLRLYISDNHLKLLIEIMVWKLIENLCMEVEINQKIYHLEISGGKELMSGNVVSGPRGGNVVSTPSSLWPSNSSLHSNAKAVITSVTSSMISNTVTIL